MNARTGASAWLDALLFSSLWTGAAAGALTGATARVLGADAPGVLAGLAFAGTVCVYNVDRLRDLERDRETSPERSRFVARHRRPLAALATAAGAVALVLAATRSPAIWGLCAGVLALGLLHRRLKGLAADAFQVAYVSVAWLAIVVGLPWWSAASGGGAEWLLGSHAAAIAANATASTARERSRHGARAGLRIAIAIAAAGAAAVAGLAPPDLRELAWLPAAQLASLVPFRTGERYAAGIVDGALLVGALLVALRVSAASAGTGIPGGGF